MVYAPVRSIIPSLKLGDYLSVQAHKPCSISHLKSNLQITETYSRTYKRALLCIYIIRLKRTSVHSCINYWSNTFGAVASFLRRELAAGTDHRLFSSLSLSLSLSLSSSSSSSSSSSY